MKKYEDILYHQIEKIINAIKKNVVSPICLTEIAKDMQLSPESFQQLFSEWADTSPKKFLQYISVEHARKTLKGEQTPATFFDTADETRRDVQTSCLTCSFISMESMDACEHQNGGKILTIQYDYKKSPFGRVIIASTPKGICYMAFYVEEEAAFKHLKSKFPNATFENQANTLQQNALAIFENDYENLPEITLHVKGTDFQVTVWQSLLNIGIGKLFTYGALAKQIDKPNASRAVGTAIGSNPVAFLIPCHRVLQSTGNFGGYMWGSTRKTAMIGWEAAKINKR